MKKVVLYILFWAFSAGVVAAEILAYWDFGMDKDSYTEVVTIDGAAGTPLLYFATYYSSVKDANGKNGTAYTDPDGVPHAAGQGAAIDEAWDDAGVMRIQLDGRGFQLTSWRWDAFTDDTGGSQGPNTFDVRFSVDAGATWQVIGNDVVFKAAGEKDEYYSYEYNLSGYGALSNAASVWLQLDDFKAGTGGACGFDNLLVAGRSVARPELSLSPSNTEYYVRPGDPVAFTVTATETGGETMTLSVSNLPVGASFPHKTGTSPLSSSFYWLPSEPGRYAMTFTASDGDGSAVREVVVYVMQEHCSLMLNEANTVASSTNLPYPDAAFVHSLGNGGNWFELMVVEDHLDVRGWQLQWAETGQASKIAHDYWYGNASIAQGILTFSDHEDLADLRSGTVITIIENAVALTSGNFSVTDLTFNPAAGDWHINFCSEQEVLAGGRYLTTQSNNSTNAGDFAVGDDNWQMRILDAEGLMVAPPVGEGINGCEESVSKTEVLALKKTFDPAMRTAADYTDRDWSSFGKLNLVDRDTGELQDAARLRAWQTFQNSGQLVINEYNAVAPDCYLGGDDPDCSDELLGRILGNGGSWMELVVAEDHLDIRGWELRWVDADGAGTLTFGQTNLWSDLRKGSIITLAREGRLVNESTNVLFEGSDFRYAPESGDFWIHVSTGFEATQAVPAVQGAFRTGAQRWEGALYDAGGSNCFGPVGEAYMEKSVSTTECVRLHGEVTGATYADFDDDNDSTFGMPNPLPDDGVQDWDALRAQVPVPPLLLNEYNCVRNGEYLRDTGADARFGRIAGNGGNWMEFIVTQDHLDLRGWRIQWAEQGDTSGEYAIWLPQADIKQGEITFSQSEWLADFRAGAILTLIETDLYLTDLLFDPINDAWWMNICTREVAATGHPLHALVTTEINVSGEKAGTFSVGHEDWIIRLLDASGTVRQATFGEDRVPVMSISRDEVARREADNGLSDWMHWDDAGDSSFGLPNRWGGVTQSLDVLRQWYPGSEPGDQDDDAMPDAWEVEELGTTGARPQVDVDTDEYSNLQEYIAQTDPTDPASFLKVGMPGNSPACTFFAASGRVYQVECTTNLTTPAWTLLQGGLRGTNEELTVPWPLDAAGKFFRITVERDE